MLENVSLQTRKGSNLCKKETTGKFSKRFNKKKQQKTE